VKWACMISIFIISSLSSIAHNILFSHSSKNVSPDNMSIKPEPPTSKIMLLSTSVIRQKRPDLRRGISVRIPTNTLRNSLRVISLRLLSLEEELAKIHFSRGSCTGLSLLPPRLFFLQLPRCLRPQVQTSRGSPSFAPTHASKLARPPFFLFTCSALAEIL
jgi:hypothetical protein